MLDAFIIEKIQQERELVDRSREQLQIEHSRERERAPDSEPRGDNTERGIAIIDFTI